MPLDSIAEILASCSERNLAFWQVVLEADVEERQVCAGASFEKMRATWRAMLDSAESYDGGLRSVSGLSGGDGELMLRYAAGGAALGGGYISEVIATALCVGESNACMRKIVAAPTAGACGVLPAVLVPLYRRGEREEDILRALYTAAGIGAVINSRASISGAAGGDWQRLRHGGGRAGAAARRRSGADGERLGHGAQEPHGPHLRPRGRARGGAMREAERYRRRERRQLRGHGPRGHNEPHPCGRGYRLHGHSG